MVTLPTMPQPGDGPVATYARGPHGVSPSVGIAFLTGIGLSSISVESPGAVIESGHINAICDVFLTAAPRFGPVTVSLSSSNAAAFPVQSSVVLA